MALTDTKVRNAKWTGKTTQGDKLTVQVYGETVELTDEPISVQRQ